MYIQYKIGASTTVGKWMKIMALFYIGSWDGPGSLCGRDVLLIVVEFEIALMIC